MSQANSTLNFLIHDANGQPQVVKVVQKANSRVPQVVKPNPVKVIRVPAASSEEVKAPVYRAVTLSGIKTGLKNLEVLQLAGETTKEVPLIKTEPIVQIEEGEVEEGEETSQEDISELNYYSVVPKATPRQNHEIRVTSAGSTRDLSSNMSHGTRRRHDSDNDPPVEYTTKRRKHADKVGKGLRHFSMKVCEKVRNKGFTSYNEVADELVLEFAAGMHGTGDSQQYDQKNIRRRVYDALNVLMAMNIISKEKKEIRWLGLPTNSVQECNALEKEKQEKLDQIQKKTQQLQELILQHISFKSLIERNKEAENKGVKPSPSSAIHLPFIVVNTSDKALIDCSISNDKTEYMFNFNKKFQIHDDIDILKRMGLLFGLDKGECTEEDIEKAKSMVPKSLENYVVQMAKGGLGNITSLLEEEYLEEADEEEEALEGEGEGEPEQGEDQEEQETNEYSDDSSDVDV